MPKRFELTGSAAAGGTLTCTGDDGAGGTCTLSARAAPAGLAGKALADLAAEVLRRGIAWQDDAVPLAFEYDTVTEAAIPILYCYPRGSVKAPVVLFNHGTGGDAVSQLFMGIPLARAGFFTVLLDARCHGRRRLPNWNRHFTGLRYKQTYVQMLIDTCADLSRLIDHLAADPRADVQRVGVTGISQGGFVSFMAITREPRITVAAPIIGSPDLEDRFGDSEPLAAHPPEFQALVREVSPLRHAERMPPVRLLVQNGTDDELVPVTGTRRLDARLRELYRDLPGHYEYREYSGVGHDDKLMRQPAIDWLVRHLEPERPQPV